MGRGALGKLTRLLEVHHALLTIPLGEEGKAREFYGGFLGLLEIAKPEVVLKNGGFWLGLGDFQLHIGCYAEPLSGRRHHHVAFVADDLEAYRRRAEELGVPWEDTVSYLGFRRAYVFDPWGNRIELLEPAAAAKRI